MADDLLADKRVPPSKALSAIAIAVFIVASLWYALHELQEHHMAAHDRMRPQGPNARRDAALPLVTLAFPLSAMLAIVLIIPLGVYVSDHAAFQSLHVLRPDHYVRLVCRVYTAFIEGDGKIAGKEL